MSLVFDGCHVTDEGALEFQAVAVQHKDGKDSTYFTNAEFLNDVCGSLRDAAVHAAQEFYEALAQDFLASRGLDQDFVDFLVDYVDQKENAEYVNLLKGIKAFATK